MSDHHIHDQRASRNQAAFEAVPVTTGQTTSMVGFDCDGKLVEASGEFQNLSSVSSDLAEIQNVLGEYLGKFETIDGVVLSDKKNLIDGFTRIWGRTNYKPIEACMLSGGWRLLSCCATAGGGTTYFSINIDYQKTKEKLIPYVLENHSLPIWVNDADTGSILYYNPAARNMYQVTLGKDGYPNVANALDDHEIYLGIIERLKNEGTLDTNLIRAKASKDKDVWIKGCLSLHEFEGKNIVIGAIQDLTDHKQVEDDTRKAHEVLKDAIQSLTEGFALYDEDSRLVMFNERYREMNHGVADLLEPGLEWEILMRESARRGIYSEAVGAEDNWVSERLESGIEFTQDYELKQTDGTTYLVSVHPTKLGGFVVTRTDITEKKQAEGSERDSDLLVRMVLETSSAAVVMAHIGTAEIIYRSPAATRLFGTKKSAVEHYISVDDRADYTTILLADGRVTDYKLNMLRGNGEVFPGMVSGQIAEYKGEEVVVTSVIDLTEQLEAEAMIRKVLEACPVPVQMTNAQTGKLIFRSPKTIELFGKAERAQSYYVDESEREEYLKELREVGWLDDRRARFRNAKGEVFIGAVSARLIEFNGEEVIVSNTRDLTDELAIEEELSSQRDMLFQNEKMSALGELLAGVAHELNNPLSIIVGHSLMLREEVHEPDTVRRIEKISTAAERCAKIVKTFLAMARQQPARMERTDVNAIISTAVDVAGYGQSESGLEISFTPDDRLPRIVADADQITQVIINLILNAEQAIAKSETGNKIKVTVDHNMTTAAIEIFVSDNGPGIPERIRQRIFEPFFTTKDIGDGTGIGLAFCHRIIHSHGGRIWLDQYQKEGSRFCISLPIIQDNGDKNDTSEIALGNGVDKKVLVVDDELEVAELICEILEKEGFQVDVAHNGNEAITALHNSRYDVLLSDVNMPQMDGRELYDFVAVNFPDLLKYTGFITGDTMGPASQSLLEESKIPHLEKPVSPAELRELIYGMLNKESD